MATPKPSTSGGGTVEREMNVHQRSLVDTCFEEEQYEAGIAVLDQLRSPKYKPFPAHIRQLIYIALYPPPDLEEERQPAIFRLEPGSPSKAFARQQATSHAPPPAAVQSALRLLTAFVHTNSPEAISRALPSYPEPGAAADTGMDDEDSFIAKQAVRIKSARSVWEVLREGFVQRAHGAASVPAGKRKGRRPVVDEDDGFGADVDGPSAVGPYAWPVLDWFVTLLERDEQMAERRGQRESSLAFGLSRT
ncbi:hypothetical protein B0H21DRAFT_727424 [Amylocystis lapponica]|nr:hypothetical protein B0H21DRAFT_727424 [Amylocystis lapponica]